MTVVWAFMSIVVVAALLGLAGWTFVIAPHVVPTRHSK